MIPGARNPGQVVSNAAAGEAAPLPAEVLDGVRRIFDEPACRETHPALVMIRPGGSIRVVDETNRMAQAS